ncbi:MAG: hypothetical protein IJI25_05670 [Eubacterium sp.]|nr:hypothetical protein [Eubacterium sp.]
MKKLLAYIPVMILTNLSTLLLICVDGIVVGNLLGHDALSSVNIFYPSFIMIGVVSDWVAAGISTVLSVCMGENNQPEILSAKLASKRIMLIAALFVSLIQIPIVTLIINSYHLSPEMARLTWQYAIGIMIASPFGLISTVGVLQLQIIGKMKVLLRLSLTESLVNLLLDLLFVGAFHMGVAGAGFGTMTANIVRCTLTVLYIALRTDIYKSKGAVSGWKEVRKILTKGLPDGANSLMLAFQNIFLMKIILSSLGETGGAIKGVCASALSVALVLVNSILGSSRPLSGIMTGGQDWEGMRLLIRRGILLVIILVGGFTVVCEFFPGLFYMINGVKEIPDMGLFMLQLFALHFLFKGINALFRLYFSFRHDTRFTTLITIIGNATLPLFAFGLTRILPAAWLWAAYTLTELVLLSFNLTHYRKRLLKDQKELEEDIGLFYLTLKPDEAIEASREIRAYADENGFDKNYSYRIALCIEEMAAYASSSQGNGNINIQIMIRFQENGAIFMMLDDGKCIALDHVEETQDLITSNYGLLKKLAKTVDYQYVLNMNYSIFTF